MLAVQQQCVCFAGRFQSVLDIPCFLSRRIPSDQKDQPRVRHLTNRQSNLDGAFIVWVMLYVPHGRLTACCWIFLPNYASFRRTCGQIGRHPEGSRSVGGSVDYVGTRAVSKQYILPYLYLFVCMPIQLLKYMTSYVSCAEPCSSCISHSIVV